VPFRDLGACGEKRDGHDGACLRDHRCRMSCHSGRGTLKGVTEDDVVVCQMWFGQISATVRYVKSNCISAVFLSRFGSGLIDAPGLLSWPAAVNIKLSAVATLTSVMEVKCAKTRNSEA
jgi:hypothetical protein